jgi:hypothetical protein
MHTNIFTYINILKSCMISYDIYINIAFKKTIYAVAAGLGVVAESCAAAAGSNVAVAVAVD